MSDPILTYWDAEAKALRPVGKKWTDKAVEQFADGERYYLSEHQQRSHNSHSHYFASVYSAWKNLPEEYAQEFPTDEHLRKWALIKAGYCDHYRIAFKNDISTSEALAMVKHMDSYAVVRQHGDCLDVFTPKSQSFKAMGKTDFQASKDAVLDIIAAMIGTTTEQLNEASEA